MSTKQSQMEPPSVRGNGQVDAQEEARSPCSKASAGDEPWLQTVPPEWLQASATVYLHGLEKCAQLNYSTARVLEVDCVRETAVVQCDGGMPDWRLPWENLGRQNFATVFESHSWVSHTPEWLTKEDFNVKNVQATSDLLFNQGLWMWPEESDKRGVDVEAAYYPLLRPRSNPALAAKCNGKVPTPPAALRTEPVPRQCAAQRTEVIPLPERKVWPKDVPLPMPPAMCRAARLDKNTGQMEPGTPYERLTAWCRSYFVEWDKVKRGTQKGKNTHRFDPDQLSEGGREGLIIQDYYKDEFKDYQWDHSEHWADNTKPCRPMNDESAQKYSEWYLKVMADDAKAMKFVDKNM